MEIVPVKVSQEVNKKLKEPYTVNEVRKTLFQMHPTKASRIDGFSAMFYQKFWELVQYDVCEEVLKFLNEGELDQSMNETLIILVPKIKCACTVGEFRPISLYNVIMKIITKVLANRLKDRGKVDYPSGGCTPCVFSDQGSSPHANISNP
ncbi:unnamed protein product [Rhodiola kirilowii]